MTHIASKKLYHFSKVIRKKSLTTTAKNVTLYVGYNTKLRKQLLISPRYGKLDSHFLLKTLVVHYYGNI